MALSRTDLIGAIDPASSGAHGTTDYTTSSFTPPSTSLLVVGGVLFEANGSTTDPTTDFGISGGSLTWTQRVAQVVVPTAYPTVVKIWTAPVTTGASMTVTLTAAGRTAGFYALGVAAYTGYDTSAPTGATGTTSSGTLNSGVSPIPATITLSSAPAAASEVFAILGVSKDTTGTTPGATFTEVYDFFQSTYGGAQTEVRTGSTSTTVDWADVRPGGGNLFEYAAAALEVKAAPPPWATFGYDVRIGG